MNDEDTGFPLIGTAEEEGEGEELNGKEDGVIDESSDGLALGMTVRIGDKEGEEEGTRVEGNRVVIGTSVGTKEV